MPSFRNKVSFEAVVLKTTDSAILCEIEGRDDHVWLPQSQIDDDSEIWKEGDEGTLVISEWIATQKGLV